MPWPFSLAGPQFLMVYGTGLIIALVIALVAYHNLDAFGSNRPKAENPDLGPYEVTFLAGGPQLTLSAACARLDGDGIVDFRVEGKLPKLLGKLPADAHRLEQRIVALVRKKGAVTSGRLMSDCSGEFGRLKRSLQAAGLLISSKGSWAFKALRLGPLAVLGLLGLARLVQGLANGRPVLFLVLGLILNGILLAKFSADIVEISDHGERTLKRLRARNDALHQTANSNWNGLSGRDRLLATGLFGTALLSSPIKRFLRRYGGMARPRPASLTGGAACSSTVTACGSSCGASCGGGGCGGCGGCGG